MSPYVCVMLDCDYVVIALYCSKLHGEVKDMYITAACQSPDNIDPDVQVIIYIVVYFREAVL